MHVDVSIFSKLTQHFLLSLCFLSIILVLYIRLIRVDSTEMESSEHCMAAVVFKESLDFLSLIDLLTVHVGIILITLSIWIAHFLERINDFLDWFNGLCTQLNIFQVKCQRFLWATNVLVDREEAFILIWLLKFFRIKSLPKIRTFGLVIRII